MHTDTHKKVYKHSSRGQSLIKYSPFIFQVQKGENLYCRTINRLEATMPSQRSQTQKDHILYNFIYIKCPEETNGSGEGTPRECGVSSKSHKNILKFFCSEGSFND